MAVKPPAVFTDVPTKDLWSSLKVAEELRELAANPQDQAYWSGWFDGMAVLLGDLLGKTDKIVGAKNSELKDLFLDFRMEDTLLELEEKMRREGGL